MARPNSIAVTLSAALVFLTYASSPVVAVDEHSNGQGQTLRGNKKSQMDTTKLLVPMDDIRRTTNPFEMATNDVEEDHHSGRELANGEKRRQRMRKRDQDTSDRACSGSRPRKCGCPSVFQSDYRGRQSTTEFGFTCRAWSDRSIEHYPNQGLEDGAVCRNPNGVAGRAWCFVDDENHPEVIWDYCDVMKCDDDGFSDVTNTGTTGNNVHVPGCVDTTTYYEIDAKIAGIVASMDDDVDKSHFIGGVLRLAAHDFMVRTIVFFEASKRWTSFHTIVT